MATSIYFGGRVTRIPGSYTEVDASALSRVGLGAVGIVACIGEAEDGAPYSEGATDGIHKISNPGKVAKTFRSGDLLEAGNMLFDPSKDPDIPAGAAAVYFLKVNPATQSSFTFDNADGDALTLTSVGWGLFTTQINVEIASGTNQGKAITIVLEDVEESFDDVGGDAIFTALYTPGANGATTMTLAVDPATGVEAAFTRDAAGLSTDYTGRIDPFAGNLAEQLATIGAGNVASVVSSDNADTTQTATVYGIDNATGLPVSEDFVLNGSTPVVGATTWTRIHGFVLDAVAVGTVTLRDNVGPVSLHDIAIGQTSVGGGVEVFAGSLEIDASTLDVYLSGAGTPRVMIIGTDDADLPTLEEVLLAGATPVTTSTTWNSISAVACGYVDGGRNVIVEGLILNSGDVVSVVSSNALDTTQTATVYGLDVAGDPQTEAIALDGVTPVAGTATWSQVLAVILDAVAVGTVTLSSATEAVTLLQLAPAALYGGFDPIDNVAVDGAALSVVADGASTRPMLLVGLSAAGVAQAELITLAGAVPVAGVSTWSALTGVAVGHVEAARTVTVSGDAIDLAVATYDTVQKVIDFGNSKSGWTFVAVTADPSGFDIADMDATAATSVLSATVSYYADLWAIVETLNDQSRLVTAAAATGATGAPDNTSSATYLAGGTEGTTGFSDWQAALDLLRDEDVNTIVVLTDDAAVHAAVVAHCVYMAAAGRNERDAVLGEETAITLANAQAASLALNTRHASLCIQDVERYNTAGVLEQFPPYFAACIAAGMHSGGPVGTAITFKYANVLDVVGNEASYTVRDDGEDILDSGLLVLERVAGRGFRWVRGVTTYQVDDNLAYVEASTNAAVNFAVKEFRRRMETAVGKRGFAGTVNAALSVAVAILGELIGEAVITDWKDLTIELTDDVMDVDVSIAPIVPVNFVRNTIHLVSSTLSAAA